MIDFTIYKPVRQDAMNQVNATNEEEFAKAFASIIAKVANCELTGSFRDGLVHLCVEESNELAVVSALDARRLPYGR